MKHDLHTKIYNMALVVFFITIIYSCFIATTMRYNPNPAGIEEKRSKAPFPVLEVKNPGRFISDFDKYIADNFGIRYILIDIHTKFRHHVLNAYSSENKVLEFFGLE